MNPSVRSSTDLSIWDCHAGDVEFAIAASTEWLSAQRAYLSGFLAPPPRDLDLAAFKIRVHADDTAFRQVVDAVTHSPNTHYIEPVPGLLMQASDHPTGGRSYVIATDNVEHQPGAYAVAVEGHDIDLLTHSGTVRPHRYPIRLMREAMLRTYEDAGGVVFHAAGVDVAGAAVMICGPRGAGKTTVAAALLKLPGTSLLSNDRLIAYQGNRVVAVPLPVPTAQGTIQAFPELERLVAHPMGTMPVEFGSTIKHAFTARQFAETFGARLLSHSTLRLVIVPRLVDSDEPAYARALSVAEAHHVVAANCFTPHDEFWIHPWLVARQRTDEQLSRQAGAAIEHIVAAVPCIEVGFGVRNPVSDLLRVVAEATGGVR